VSLTCELPKDICACGDFRYEHDSITGRCHPCYALGSGIPNAPGNEFRLHTPQTATDGAPALAERNEGEQSK
jgi:hypothetical protein